MRALGRKNTCFFGNALPKSNASKTEKKNIVANAISSFKWPKIFMLMRNRHHQYWVIWLTKHLYQHLLIIFTDISIDLKHARNLMIMGLA